MGMPCMWNDCIAINPKSMKPDDVIYISKSDLNYQGVTTGHKIDRATWFRTKRWNGRYLIERITESRYDALMREERRREYDKAIQKKYKVGPDWRQNRWFIEQVRPTL